MLHTVLGCEEKRWTVSCSAGVLLGVKWMLSILKWNVTAILDSQSKGSLRLGIERNFNQEGGYDLPKPNYYL